MSTINNMISSNFISTNNAAKKEIAELRKQMSDLRKDTTLTAEQRTAKQKEYTEKIDALNEELSAGQSAQLSNISGGVMGLFSPNNDGMSGFDIFFGANASMSSLKTINSARLGIESRARNLLAEIRMDSIRGIDTSDKRELLGNLTANLDIMNKNLGNNIDRAMADPKQRQTGAPSIIDRINADLKKIQEKEEKKVQEKYGQREAPEEAAETNGED